MSKILDEIDKQLKQYSSVTIQQYRRHIVGFVKWRVQYGTESREQLATTTVREIDDFLSSSPLPAASTQNQAINAIEFLFREVLDAPKSLSVLRARTGGQTIPDTISHKLVGEVIYHLRYPHKLIAWLIYASGLTVKEILKLRVTDFDHQALLVGRVKASGWVAPRLAIWIEDARLSPDDHLFPVGELTFVRHLRLAGNRARSKTPVTPMTLRYSGALRLLEQAPPATVPELQQWLGVSARTAFRYIERLGTSYIKDVVSPLDILEQ